MDFGHHYLTVIFDKKLSKILLIVISSIKVHGTKSSHVQHCVFFCSEEGILVLINKFFFVECVLYDLV